MQAYDEEQQRKLSHAENYNSNLKKEIENLTEEKRTLRDTLNKLDANYRISFRDSGIHEAKIKDLE